MPPVKKGKEKESGKDKATEKEMEIEMEMGTAKEAETEKEKSKKQDKKEERQLGKMVTIQNRSSEPLHFSAPGFECRIRPFDTAEVPETALAVGQLQRFLAEGLVVLKTASVKAPDPERGTEKPPEGGADRRVADRRERRGDEPEGEE